MASATLEAFYLDNGAGSRRFCLHHVPARHVQGLVVFAHAWCEEMNKSRRMVASQARQWAEAGFAVLVPDLTGCGDSSGDFADARWDTWVEDIVDACRWMRQRHGGAATPPLTLWAQRSGALLAVQAAARLGDVDRFVFWQPVAQGKQVAQQFLRLAMAAGLADGSGKAALAALKQQLAAGEPVLVAGYTVSPALIEGLEAAVLDAPGFGPCRATFIDISPQAEVSPATSALADRWRAARHEVALLHVTAPAFWQTTEIEDAPGLCAAGVEALQAGLQGMVS